MILNIPDNIKVFELMPLGYPADTALTEKQRLDLDEIVRFDQW